MVEESYPWSGTVVGDAGPYSDDDWSDAWNTLFCVDRTLQGYVAGVLNELAVSGVASPVTVGSGSALVDGKFYYNSADTTVAIPTPAVSTRIDRIVLRKSWVAQTVRITRIEGIEGGGAPAITQNDGTTWDIKLAQTSTTVGGVITVTDERSICADPRAKLVNDLDPALGATLDCDANKIDNIGDMEFDAGGAVVDIIRDEDDMVSDDANAVSTQQSIKKYVDDSVLRIETGEYTGDGAVSQQINLSDGALIPTYVRIWEKITSDGAVNIAETTDTIIDDQATGNAIIIQSATIVVRSDRIIALAAGSFTVDDGAGNLFPNENTQVYNYMVLGTH